MLIRRISQISLLSLLLTASTYAASVSDYNVVWETPSRNSSGSMPIGNGDIGANVWVEPNGDLLLLLSKTDAWSENGRILKIGVIGVSP